MSQSGWIFSLGFTFASGNLIHICHLSFHPEATIKYPFHTKKICATGLSNSFSLTGDHH